jgi:type III restriction enzyme
MKLQFEANQPFQLEAISAVTRLFDGQPHASAPYTNLLTTNWFGLYQGQTQNELGLANHLAIPTEQLLANTRAVHAFSRSNTTFHSLGSK